MLPVDSVNSSLDQRGCIGIEGNLISPEQLKNPKIKNILVVGFGEELPEVYKLVCRNKEKGVQIVGYLNLQDLRLGQWQERPSAAEEEIHAQLGPILLQNYIDSIVMHIPTPQEGKFFLMRSQFYGAIQLLAIELGLDLSIVQGKRQKMINGEAFSLRGTSLIRFSPYDRLTKFVKRTIDLLITCAALIVLAPLLLIVAILIKLTSEGPVFYNSARGGLRGKPFKMYKFRTMVKNAEELKTKLLHLNEMEGNAFKLANDPRLTSIGGFLRKTSIDELPQLFNILKGDMSVVGPRPLPVLEAQRVRFFQNKRHAVKPGLVCLWQISGRSQIKVFDHWMDLDLSYIDQFSWSLDTKIFFKSFFTVLSCKGAS